MSTWTRSPQSSHEKLKFQHLQEIISAEGDRVIQSQTRNSYFMDLDLRLFRQILSVCKITFVSYAAHFMVECLSMF